VYNLDIRSARLSLRAFVEDDAAFVLGLMNEPDFHQYIGDRGVRSLDDARRYLRDGPIASYARHGHGLLQVSRADDGTPLGMCGLVRREGLPGPDIGFAITKVHEGQGYATEAALAVMTHCRQQLGIKDIYGITQSDNTRSINTLQKLGLRWLEARVLTAGGPPLWVFINTAS
jgi:ribosomal-protein-alanine N-acetyltransferase